MDSNFLLKTCCCFRRNSPNNLTLRHQENLISLDSIHIGQEVVVLKNGTRACGSGGVVLSTPLLQSKSYFEVKIQQEGHWSIGVCTLNTELNKTRGGLDAYSWVLNAENLVMNNGKVIYDLNEMYQPHSDIENPSINRDTDQLLPFDNAEITSNSFPNMPSPKIDRGFVLPQEGDILGITYDHIELNFYVNGKSLNIPTLIKLNTQLPNGSSYNNEIYPCLFVDDGAILDVILDNFNYQIPSGYEKILVEQTLL